MRPEQNFVDKIQHIFLFLTHFNTDDRNFQLVSMAASKRKEVTKKSPKAGKVEG